MSNIAIIPARGGSKGVPGKNIKLIDGKPLIAYTIEAALQTKLIDHIIVSSDSEEILSVSADYSDVFIHKRNEEIAGDKSSISETIFAILHEYADLAIDNIILLQPTSPLRTATQIDEAISRFIDSHAKSLISVCEMDDVHPARMYWNKEGLLEPIMPEYEQLRRQEIPKALYRNGSIYITDRETFVKTGAIMNKPSIGFIMPYSQLLNIDEPRDLIIAEALVSAWNKGML